MQLDSLPKHLHRLMKPKRVAIVEACVIGVVSGLAAVLLKQGVGWLGGLRIESTYLWPAWIALPIVGLVGGLVAGWLVQQFAPEAVGSGIPQVKAALAYVPMPLNLRIAIVKLISTMLVMGSGLTLGRQGPTVQIGAALAAWLSRWVPTSPEYRRQLIAAGAAAGLASGFNAPIAGVLLVVEEFLQDFSGLTLGTAILSSFVGAVVSRLLGGEGLAPSMTGTAAVDFSVQDIPFFLLLGLLAGLLGALFNRGIFVSLSINQRLIGLSLPGLVALAGFLSGIGRAFLPIDFRDNAGLREFLVVGDASWHLILIAFVITFLLTLVAYGSGAPGGLFAPALVLGSSIGTLVGKLALAMELLVGIPLGIPPGISSTTTYALAGMGAFFSAVTRVPITAIVIVFEMTTDFSLVLPLMIGSVVAYLIADRVDPGSVYTRILARKGIHLETKQAGSMPLAQLTAADVMQRRVETLSSQMSLREVVQAFSRSHHRGFPVVQNGQLVGIVSQSDLSDISEVSGNHPSSERQLAEIMTPNPVTVSPKDQLPQVLYLLNRFKLSRLPVVEDQRLVGIITRADIIRAESDHLSGQVDQLGPQPEPSYVVYQTRSPVTGKGRILVPLANPKTAPILLEMAAAIARQRQYEIECLQIIEVSRRYAPAATPVDTTASRNLLTEAELLCEQWNIAVHTQIRVAHDIAHTVLDVIKDRHIDLTLMGWKGGTATPERVFGNVVDTIIRQATCEVVLIRLGEAMNFNRWLIPVAGGPNALQAVQLVPALATIGHNTEVVVCQVFPPDQKMTQRTEGMIRAIQVLRPAIDSRIMPLCLVGTSVADTLLQVARRYQTDVILMGATRDSLLQQVIQGNIPEAVARRSHCTVILVRSADTGLVQQNGSA